MEKKDVSIDASKLKPLQTDKHVAYIKMWASGKEEYEWAMSEYLRMNGVYWCLTAMDLVHSRDVLETAKIVEWVATCRHENGGYSAAPGHDPHLLATLSAIQVLTILEAITPEVVAGAAGFVKGLQQPDGSFQGDKWGEIDTRFSFCALACLALIGRLDAVDVDNAASFVVSCMNFDGGFGVVPGSESHAGQIYCCVGALKIAGQLHRVDADLLGWWLAERQLPSGGFNGRPEKLPDVCYSWWVLTSLRIIGKMHWIDEEKLKTFILACQDVEDGGFADRPGDMVDPFHTLFGIAALSLLGDTTLKEINPIFCMPEEVVRRAVGDGTHLTSINPVR